MTKQIKGITVVEEQVSPSVEEIKEFVVETMVRVAEQVKEKGSNEFMVGYYSAFGAMLAELGINTEAFEAEMWK